MSAETEIRAALAAYVALDAQTKIVETHTFLENAKAAQAVYCSATSPLNITALLAKMDARQAKIDALQKDADRIDWLADKTQHIGNVQLPKNCVENNLHSLRAAIDSAIAQSKGGA